MNGGWMAFLNWLGQPPWFLSPGLTLYYSPNEDGCGFYLAERPCIPVMSAFFPVVLFVSGLLPHGTSTCVYNTWGVDVISKASSLLKVVRHTLRVLSLEVTRCVFSLELSSIVFK